MTLTLSPTEILLAKATFNDLYKEEVIAGTTYTLELTITEEDCKKMDFTSSDDVEIVATKPDDDSKLFQYTKADSEVEIDTNKEAIKLTVPKTTTTNWAVGHYYYKVYSTTNNKTTLLLDAVLEVKSKYK